MSDDTPQRPDHTAIGPDGQRLPLSPDEVQEMGRRILDQGELLAIVSRIDGNLAVQVLAAPSEEIGLALIAAGRAYFKATA